MRSYGTEDRAPTTVPRDLQVLRRDITSVQQKIQASIPPIGEPVDTQKTENGSRCIFFATNKRMWLEIMREEI